MKPGSRFYSQFFNNHGTVTRYADHAWRNPELERLLKIVEKFDNL